MNSQRLNQLKKRYLLEFSTTSLISSNTDKHLKHFPMLISQAFIQNVISTFLLISKLIQPFSSYESSRCCGDIPLGFTFGTRVSASEAEAA